MAGRRNSSQRLWLARVKGDVPLPCPSRLPQTRPAPHTTPGQHTLITWSAHGQHTVSIGSAHGQHRVSTPSAHGQHTVSTWSAQGQHMVSTRSAHGQHTVSMVSTWSLHGHYMALPARHTWSDQVLLCTTPKTGKQVGTATVCTNHTIPIVDLIGTGFPDWLESHAIRSTIGIAWLVQACEYI